MGKQAFANQPCSCGSGKKYKKCCRDKRPVPEEVIDYFRKFEAEKQRLREMGIYVHYVNPITYKGRKVWALGNQVYLNNNPYQTFHEFIIEVLLRTLGESWINTERKKSPEKKHFIVQCVEKYHEWKIRNADNPTSRLNENVWGGRPDGYSKSLVSLAFDVCSLIHTHKLPDHLLGRLKSREEYQGARYEITVAAIFARLGFSIEFLDEALDQAGKTQKHCEFIATHAQHKYKIAVEVKSRHRAGVLHQKGSYDADRAIKGDVNRLLEKALKQNPGTMPFIVFIDINSPSTTAKSIANAQWFLDVQEIMKKQGKPTPENPDPYNGIFFTNHSYHYQTENEANGGAYATVIPLYTRHPIQYPEVFTMLGSACSHYGIVPNFEEKPDSV